MKPIIVLGLTAIAALTFTALRLYEAGEVRVRAAGPTRFVGPTSSQPLALSADDSLLAVVNPDNNSVSFFNTQNAYTRLAEIPVGTEPNGVALSPDGTRAYIANTVSGTVTVLAVDRTSASIASTVATIPVGTEPYGLALTPTGRKLYVSNARSNSVSVIDTTANQVIKTITNAGIEPRGIAITNSGTGDDTQETVYVTQFLALPVPGKIDGADDAKAGHLTVISAATDSMTGEILLNPIADTGFKAAGNALMHIAPPANPAPADFTFTTGAYPNQLNSIAILGRFAFVPNTGASPNGPVRFNVNVQSLVSVIDLTAKTDAIKTINMQSAVGNQANATKLFITQPWSIAFKHQSNQGYAISAASNIVVKLAVDSATGTPTVQTDPTDSTRVLEIPTGKNPRGIVVNSSDTTAYVMNYVSRDVTVIDLTGTVERATQTLQSSNLPAAGSAADILQIGKELYYTSVGVFDPPTPGQPPITGRMSNNGWGACSGCHPFGLSDDVVWIFASGPRRTIPQHADFAPGDPTTQKALNWSAIFDEEEDFEGNIRNVSGGLGLIVLADGVTQDPNVAAFTPPSGGRNQLKVRGVNSWDAIKAYIKAIRAPISPASKTDPDIPAGRQLFIQSNCQNCHGGPQWTSSKIRYTPPPDSSLVSNTQLITELRNVGTFDPTIANEVRATAAAPLGADGFNPPTLLSLFAFPQTFFHNGVATSLDAVLQNVAHRSAGTGTDNLQDPTKRAQLVKFLLSIDSSTQPVAPTSAGTVSTVSAASFVSGTSLAAESIVSSFGSAFATQTLVATALPLPTALANTTVALRDSAGALRLAPQFFVSAGQVNFEIPAGTATGTATVTVTSNAGVVSMGTVTIATVSPGIFTANASGSGVPAATAVRTAANGTQTPVAVFQCDSAGTHCTPVPIDLGASTDSVVLTLYGTGVRNRSSLSNVLCSIGGVSAPVMFAGAQGGFAGLDQINVQLPAALKGSGQVNVVFTVDGQSSNPVTINIQ
jgi:uncharacterized protein (TIGR03437 family)